MARLWQFSSELNSAASAVEFDTAISTPAIVTSPVRTGTYAFQESGLVSATAKGFRRPFQSAAGNGPFYFRRYLYVVTRPTVGANRILFLNDTDNQTTPMVWINLATDGSLTLNDEDGAIGSASAVLSLNIQHSIEIKVDRTPAAGSQVVEARLDGSVFATSSTRNLSAGIFVEAAGGNLAGELEVTGEWYFEDFATNDSTGSFQNDYPGEGGVLHLRPSAAGDNAQWPLGTGSTFAEVDEITPDDATTYIASNTSGEISDFNIDNTPAAIGASDTINVAAVGFRGTLSDSTGADPNAVLRIKASASGTVEESSNLGGNTTTWNTNGYASPRNFKLVLYDLPGASTTAYTKADLDTTQIGVRETNTDTHNYQISALWLSVDFTPAVAGGSVVPVLMSQYRRRKN